LVILADNHIKKIDKASRRDSYEGVKFNGIVVGLAIVINLDRALIQLFSSTFWVRLNVYNARDTGSDDVTGAHVTGKCGTIERTISDRNSSHGCVAYRCHLCMNNPPEFEQACHSGARKRFRLNVQRILRSILRISSAPLFS
jgi:hypothetical protein